MVAAAMAAPGRCRTLVSLVDMRGSRREGAGRSEIEDGPLTAIRHSAECLQGRAPVLEFVSHPGHILAIVVRHLHLRREAGAAPSAVVAPEGPWARLNALWSTTKAGHSLV